MIWIDVSTTTDNGWLPTLLSLCSRLFLSFLYLKFWFVEYLVWFKPLKPLRLPLLKKWVKTFAWFALISRKFSISAAHKMSNYLKFEWRAQQTRLSSYDSILQSKNAVCPQILQIISVLKLQHRPYIQVWRTALNFQNYENQIKDLLFWNLLTFCHAIDFVRTTRILVVVANYSFCSQVNKNNRHECFQNRVP